jgi:hypothetical protein
MADFRDVFSPISHRPALIVDARAAMVVLVNCSGINVTKEAKGWIRSSAVDDRREI